MTLKEAGCWYPVYTNPRAEKKALENLIKAGVEAYLPVQKKLKQWSDRKKWVYEPLIPSYIFVFANELALQKVLQISGISRFIYFSGKIATIPLKQLNEIKLILASEHDFEVSAETFEPGEKVRIKAGALKDLTGEFLSFKGNQRFVIKLQNMGYSIAIVISSKLVERI